MITLYEQVEVDCEVACEHCHSPNRIQELLDWDDGAELLCQCETCGRPFIARWKVVVNTGLTKPAKNSNNGGGAA